MRRSLKRRGHSPAPVTGVKIEYPDHYTRPGAFKEAFDAAAKALADLPESDNTEGAVERMLRANAILRHLPWPKPFDETSHELRRGDARDLSGIASESVHLVVTSPNAPGCWRLADASAV